MYGIRAYIYEHFFEVLSLYLEARMRIENRIRNNVKGRTRMRIKVISKIRIRIKVTSGIPIRIIVMRIRNTEEEHPYLAKMMQIHADTEPLSTCTNGIRTVFQEDKK